MIHINIYVIYSYIYICISIFFYEIFNIHRMKQLILIPFLILSSKYLTKSKPQSTDFKNKTPLSKSRTLIYLGKKKCLLHYENIYILKSKKIKQNKIKLRLTVTIINKKIIIFF